MIFEDRSLLDDLSKPYILADYGYSAEDITPEKRDMRKIRKIKCLKRLNF